MKKILIIILAAFAILTLTRTVKAPLEQQETALGGITRVAIGTQTKWTTDLIPSASFTVNLGSPALPVSKIFSTTASHSIGEFTTRASASTYFGSAFAGLGGTNGCAGGADGGDDGAGDDGAAGFVDPLAADSGSPTSAGSNKQLFASYLWLRCRWWRCRFQLLRLG